jgi:glycosyltransferase involved in cell wall biosynthesis
MIFTIKEYQKSKLELLSQKLEIFIITYNRESLLLGTLSQLENSPFSNCKISVLDNKSTDNTFLIAQDQKKNFRHLNVISNKINIGANANIIRAIELSNSVYTWVLCDDDKYDFSDCEDVIDVILNEKSNLIHMGAHEEYWGFSATFSSPKELIAEGYPYFKYCSFLPCNLFRTQLFYDSIIQAYSNIANWLPHMPFLIDFYKRDENIYIAKNRIVTAVIGHQEYSGSQLLINWFNCSCYLNTKKEKLIFLLNQALKLKPKKRNPWNGIIISYGINTIAQKDTLNILRLLRVTNFYQSFLLLVSISFSPICYLKRKIIQKFLWIMKDSFK